MIKPITIITGSTRGIGKQIGLNLIKKGHYVIFTGSTQESIDLLKKEIGVNGFVYKCDFTNKEDVETFCTLYCKFNIANIIFNLGITNRTNFKAMNEYDWKTVLDVNLNIPIYIIQRFYEVLRNRIIFIGSVSGHVPDATSIPYGVSKGALEILTKYLAKEFASRKITVNTLAPGYTSTDWHVNKSKEQIKRIEEKILLKRFATVEEISHACQFLIENDYITGQTLCVDGGFNYE